MELIQLFRHMISKLYLNVHRVLEPLRFAVCLTGIILLINVSNAFCNDSVEHWNRISGPIPIVNQSPIQLLFLQPIPDRSEIYPSNRCSFILTTAVTNTLLRQNSTNHYGSMIDMEMIRSTMELKYGIFPWIEIGVSIPFVYGYGGALDHTILEVENLFDQERHLRREESDFGRTNEYTFDVRNNGKTFIGGKERSSGLGDVALRVKGKILEEGNLVPGVSARFLVKIPTGDEDRALGSGKADYGVGLLFQKTFKRAVTYLNTDVIFPGQAYKQEDITLRPFIDIMLGGEYKLNERLSALMQLSYITRPFENTGIAMLSGVIWDVVLGLSYVSKKGLTVQGGLIQNTLNSDSGSDITFFLNFGKSF